MSKWIASSRSMLCGAVAGVVLTAVRRGWRIDSPCRPGAGSGPGYGQRNGASCVDGRACVRLRPGERNGRACSLPHECRGRRQRCGLDRHRAESRAQDRPADAHQWRHCRPGTDDAAGRPIHADQDGAESQRRRQPGQFRGPARGIGNAAGHAERHAERTETDQQLYRRAGQADRRAARLRRLQVDRPEGQRHVRTETGHPCHSAHRRSDSGLRPDRPDRHHDQRTEKWRRAPRDAAERKRSVHARAGRPDQGAVRYRGHRSRPDDRGHHRRPGHAGPDHDREFSCSTSHDVAITGRDGQRPSRPDSGRSDRLGTGIAVGQRNDYGRSGPHEHESDHG